MKYSQQHGIQRPKSLFYNELTYCETVEHKFFQVRLLIVCMKDIDYVQGRYYILFRNLLLILNFIYCSNYENVTILLCILFILYSSMHKIMYLSIHNDIYMGVKKDENKIKYKEGCIICIIYIIGVSLFPIFHCFA